MGNPEGAAALCIAEGFATGATIHEATGYPVAVAFNAGNLVPVAKAIRERFAELRLIVCADDDAAAEGNPGISKATEAAGSVGGLVAIPDFGNDRPEGATDFNDLAQQLGMQTVERAIANAAAPTSTEPQPGTHNATVDDTYDGNWLEPQPLAVKVEPEPYPLDALPDTVRAAVFEVQGFTKAPIPLVASSALAALSLAIQTHADAKRAEKLHGPVGLFLLTIADSGERKSTCDGFFMKAIRDYDAGQAEGAKPILKRLQSSKRSMGSRARWDNFGDQASRENSEAGKRKRHKGAASRTYRASTPESGAAENPPPDLWRCNARGAGLWTGALLAFGRRGFSGGRACFRFAWNGQGFNHAQFGDAESTVGRQPSDH